jgi:hypothetical protein
LRVWAAGVAGLIDDTTAARLLIGCRQSRLLGITKSARRPPEPPQSVEFAARSITSGARSSPACGPNNSTWHPTTKAHVESMRGARSDYMAA